jgi:hypothetical protein
MKTNTKTEAAEIAQITDSPAVELLEMRRCLAMIEHETATARREEGLGGWLSDHTVCVAFWNDAFDTAKGEANRGAERQSVLSQLLTMRLNKSQGEIYELNQKVSELETKLELTSAWISQIFRDLGLPEGDMGALELYVQANV